MIEYKDVSFSTDGYVICRNIKLPITRTQVLDYQSQTGMDAIEVIRWLYNNNISVVRDRKLRELLS